MSETLIFGPPGTGKTHTLINIVREALASGTPPDKIGFVSFTRKSINEARERAGRELNLEEKDVPYFRTLHSMGYRWLGLNSDNMVKDEDLRQIGEEMGMQIDGRNVRDEDGLLFNASKIGNRYLDMIARSRLRMIPLEEEYRQAQDYDLQWPLLEKLDIVYSMYKQQHQKFDFVDMIDGMVTRKTAPNLDLLIVDECQDLTPLQWAQVQILRDHAERTYYAGDDDQAIFRYQGVNIDDMINVCKDRQILGQSYRVPKLVHDLAEKIAKRIGYRQTKSWLPTDRQGSIHHHMYISDIDMSTGSWTIMSRTNAVLRDISEMFRQDGTLFTHNGRLSFNENKLLAMQSWSKLQDGASLRVDDAKLLYASVPRQGSEAVVKRGALQGLSLIDPQSKLSYNDLVEHHGLLADRASPVISVVKLSEEEQRYLNAIQRRGGIETDPRIKLSTIHRMKGGEDENVVLLSDMGYLPHQTLQINPDDEHRVFYTAITRAKERLHLISHKTKYWYPL
jgi:superfamily I DNA/RNA helicase|tara:strand:+ start:4211 stop:5731 length:1521 start_codon:yes stop_codon:yes gene_type:complete